MCLYSKRLTSTGEDEREYQSDHETSWDEFDDRYDNFTAGRERLQEFSGRIPPRKKKTSSSPSSPNPSEGASPENSSCGKQREQRERAEQKVSNYNSSDSVSDSTSDSAKEFVNSRPSAQLKIASTKDTFPQEIKGGVGAGLESESTAAPWKAQWESHAHISNAFVIRRKTLHMRKV